MKKVIIALISALLLIVPNTPALAVASLVPSFGSVQSTAGGFAVPISNYDATYTWTPIATNCAKATIDSNGWLTVTGAPASTSTTVTVYTNKSGLTQSQSSVSGTSGDLTSPVNNSQVGQNTWSGKIQMGANGALYNSFTSYIPTGNRAQISKSIDNGQSWSIIKSWPVSSGWETRLLVRGQNLTAVWLDGSNILTSYSNDGGRTWSNVVTVLANGNSVGSITLEKSGDGDLLVGWQQTVNNDIEVAFATSINSGATWSASSVLSEPATTSWQPAFQAVSTGNVYAVWDTYARPVSAKYDDATNTWISGTQLPNRPNYYQHSSRGMALVGADQIALTWSEGIGNWNGMFAIYDGSNWTTPVSYAYGAVSSPRVAVSSNKIVVIYNTGYAVHMVTSALSPVSFSGATVISASGVQEQNAFVSWLSGTRFVIGWMAYSGSAMVPKYRMSSDNAATWSTTYSPSSDNVQNYSPGAFEASDGSVVLLWHTQNPDLVLKSAAISSTLPTPGAKEVYLAAEINAGATHSHIYSPKVYNNKIYFSSTTPETGRELFVYDGTSVSLVQDFIPGAGSGLYDSNSVVGVYNNKLLLVADNGSTGWELYTFDGTTISLVLDANPGTGFGRPSNFIEYQSKLYFQTYIDATTTTYGWVWNYVNPPQLLGTAYSGYVRTGFAEPKILNGVLYFRSGLTGQMAKLTSFDGTTFSEVTTTGTLPTQMSVFGNKLLYSATTANEGFEPWYFDGTSEYFIGDLNPGSVDSNSAGFTAACSGVFFQAATTSTGRELYYWNGLSTPTLVSDIQAGASDGWPQSLFATENGILFGANDGTNGTELWFSDGATTSMVANTNPGSASFQPNSMVKFGNTVYMVGNTSATGIELYAYGVKPAGFASAAYVHSYTITYDANTGNGSASSTAGAGSVNLNSGSGFSKSGMTLLGWDTNASATSPTYTVGGSYTLSANVTLYAIWGAAAAPQTPSVPATPTVPLPSPADLQKQIGTIETAGGTITIEGAGLGTTREAYAGDKRAVISNISGDKLTLAMPKQPAGYYDLTLVLDHGRVTFSGILHYVDKAGNEQNQNGTWVKHSFSIRGFKAGSSKLTPTMIKQLRSKTEYSNALTVTCTGETNGPSVLAKDPALATARARAACGVIAKQLGIKSVKIGYKNSAAKSSVYRRVLVTLVGPVTR